MHIRLWTLHYAIKVHLGLVLLEVSGAFEIEGLGLLLFDTPQELHDEDLALI